jgi:hypothetical protein
MSEAKMIEEEKGDEVLRRMLKTPPDPKTPPRPKPGKEGSADEKTKT